ncbi:MAG: hypothetical protein K2I70_00705 [Bacilli bacterium]|nr:hypothetical protein [Bacilli bacterium]
MGLISDIGDSISCMTWRDALAISCISFSIICVINLGTLIADDLTANNSFDYSMDEEGNVSVFGEIKSSVLKECYLVERKDEIGKLELSIINKDGIDILTNKFVTNIHDVDGCIISVDENILSVFKMSDYYMSDEDKLLSVDDIRELIIIIGEDFPWHNYKVLSYSY